MFRTSARCSRRICGRCCPLRIRRSKTRGLIPALPGLAPGNRKTFAAFRVVIGTPLKLAAAFRTKEVLRQSARLAALRPIAEVVRLRHITGGGFCFASGWTAFGAQRKLEGGLGSSAQVRKPVVRWLSTVLIKFHRPRESIKAQNELFLPCSRRNRAS